jgi:glutathione peroxidase
MSSTLLAIPVRSIDGAETTLAPYAGKVLLIVNVASACGFTPQYAGLESLFESERERGLVVLGFPSNDFGDRYARRPGTPRRDRARAREAGIARGSTRMNAS